MAETTALGRGKRPHRHSPGPRPHRHLPRQLRLGAGAVQPRLHYNIIIVIRTFVIAVPLVFFFASIVPTLVLEDAWRGRFQLSSSRKK
jgi:hypothetical protein